MNIRKGRLLKHIKMALRSLRIAAVTLLLSLCLFGAATAFGATTVLGAVIPDLQADAGSGERRVFDQAGLFSAKETERLEQEISGLRREMDMDVVIVTTDDTAGMITRDYADQYYIQGEFGKGNSYDGILLLIDMDSRELYVNAVGKMSRYITDTRREKLLDTLYEGASAGDFAASAKDFLSSVSTYYEKGIQGNQYNYDEKTGKISVYKSIRWYEALIAAGAAAFAGFAACLSVTNSYAMKKEHRRAGGYYMAYRADCGFRFDNQADHLVNKSVTQMIIPRSTDSHGGSGGSSSGRTTTHSSSGRTFSGGGRKF